MTTASRVHDAIGGASLGESRTMRRCLVALAICFAVLSCSPTERRSDGATTASAPASVVSFDRRFTDVTADARIDFRHDSGAKGRKLFPESLGAGVGVLDFDGDHRLDLFFVNGRDLADPASARGCALYRGNADGTFTDVAKSVGADLSCYGMGCTIADIEGDGDPDIVVTAVDGLFLLLNEGGRFREAGAERGLSTNVWTDRAGATHPAWSTAAAFFDVESDGDLDLFVTNYVQWTIETDIFTTLDGKNKAFTTPDRYVGLPPRLYLNDGQGAFRDASEAFGLLQHRGKSLGVALWDFDDDGRLDIAVANDTRPNFLFFNRGGTSFEERGVELGVAYDENGRARAGMGIDIAAYAADGVPGIAIGNFSQEPLSLYRRSTTGFFDSSAERVGLAQATFASLTFGLVFADFDLDGASDLMVANGHIEPDIERIDPRQRYRQSAQLFRGSADGIFADVSTSVGEDFRRPRVGRALATLDFDRDGDLDCLLTENGGSPALLRNDLAPGARTMNWLVVDLVGSGKNVAGIGALVEVGSGTARARQTVRTGGSYLTASETGLVFGLGDRSTVEEVRVRWPGKGWRSYGAQPTGQRIVLREN